MPYPSEYSSRATTGHMGRPAQGKAGQPQRVGCQRQEARNREESGRCSSHASFMQG